MRIFRARVAFGAAVLLATGALCVAGCGDNGDGPAAGAQSASKKPLVGALFYTDSDSYILSVMRSLEKSLEGKADYIVLSANSDQFTQEDQLTDLLRKKVDAIAINMVDPQAVSFVVDRARKAGVPIVFFNRQPDLSSLKNHGNNACYVGTGSTEAGRMQGDIIKRLLDTHPEYDRNKDGKLQYAMLQANADNPESMGRTEYSVRRARELGVGMEQVGATMMCNWDRKEAYESFRIALPSFINKLEFVVSNNDSMGLGAIDALQEMGFNLEGGDPAKYIPVIGVDAVADGVEAIKKGVMSATVRQDNELMASTVAALLLNAATGKDFLDGTSLQWDESGVAVRLPYFSYEGPE